MRTLTEEQAYRAMLLFPGKWYESTQCDDLGSLLSSLDVGFTTHAPVDSAIAEDWEESVSRALAGEEPPTVWQLRSEE